MDNSQLFSRIFRYRDEREKKLAEGRRLIRPLANIHMQRFKKFMTHKDVLIVTICLTLAILITGFVVWPHHKEFTAVGDIVPVQELGIDGSVHFTYVESGITMNHYDELMVLLNYDGVSFVPLTDEDLANLTDYYTSETDEYKEETIENAVTVANWEGNSYGLSSDLSGRIQEIIDYSEGYYGDSIGLMTAVGLVEEMAHSDYSHGGKYIIAGTGTMEEDQTVGSIGAIREKLLTAVQNDVDYFFIPKDKYYYDDESFSNEVEAEKMVKEENLPVHIVPVGTLDEAIFYLENLP